ncbi:MAG: HDIG domain-containing protein [Candidatus Aenigmarchaeota archaeon]|nr:HDIG domain-containing protein [Candidatus Aenigmarchaeota archaeon]
MKELIELANKIKDKDLRKKTIEMLKDASISNKSMKYPKADLEKVPAWIGTHHSYEGGLIKHTLSVTRLALDLADTFEKTYKTKVNRDFIISGALLHDIMKVFILKKHNNNWTFTGCILDHALFSAAELYARNFPEEVVHIVGSHGGDLGATGANPKTIEAQIVLQADVIDAAIDTEINPPKPSLQFMLMGEE